MSEAPKKIVLGMFKDEHDSSKEYSQSYIRADLVDELVEALVKVNPILHDALSAIGKILVERDRGMGYFHAEVDWLVSRQQEIRCLQKSIAALARVKEEG